MSRCVGHGGAGAWRSGEQEGRVGQQHSMLLGSRGLHAWCCCTQVPCHVGRLLLW
jgi:hypothetical protein